MTHTLCFSPDGKINCLYTEAIDLQALGDLRVSRATDIAFNEITQQWEVCHADHGAVLFSHASRETCLRWEHANLQPGN